MNPVVTVVVPAYNARETIAHTLASIQAQDLREIEIRVVDDGSHDDTREIVAGLAGADPRIVLITQPNGGVARARNTGLAEANGRFSAFCDADDIWHPEKLARQVASLEADPGAGLSYAWHRRIDPEDRLLAASATPRIEGSVLHRHLEWNFISNGSTVLVPTPLARETGFEPALHEAGNQGCEDYLFQLLIARNHRFVCVPAFLVGYRIGNSSMSHGVDRMIRSHLQTFAIIEAYDPNDGAIKRIIARRRTKLLVELFRNRIRRRDLPAATGALLGALRNGPLRVPGFILDEVKTGMSRYSDIPVRKSNSEAQTGRHFAEFGAEESDGAWATKRSARYLAALGELDARRATVVGSV